jgi:co-chaperonin GroES (HSP10)
MRTSKSSTKIRRNKFQPFARPPCLSRRARLVEKPKQHHPPDSAKEKPQEAKVIALGTGKKGEDGKVTPFEVKVGDTVLISKYGGTEVKLGDKKYTLVREDDILGVIA